MEVDLWGRGHSRTVLFRSSGCREVISFCRCFALLFIVLFIVLLFIVLHIVINVECKIRKPTVFRF